MALKVGDKLIIRENLVADEYYGYIRFDGNMAKYCGKNVTITKTEVGNRSYKIDIDGGCWNWSEEMFKEVTPKDLIEIGVMAESREGEYYMAFSYILGGDIFLINMDGKSYRGLKYLTDDLKDTGGDRDMDIIRLFKYDTYTGMFNHPKENLRDKEITIWSRTRQVTKQEIADKFGISINELEIIEEEN